MYKMIFTPSTAVSWMGHMLLRQVYLQKVPKETTDQTSHMFLYFCSKFNRPVCPTDRATLMAFARLESLTISFGTLKNIFSSIKFLHQAQNQVFPDDDWQLESTLKALKRELSGAPLQTLPITPEILLKMYMFVDIAAPKGIDIILLHAKKRFSCSKIYGQV
jgi:hypothetical protein